MIDGEAGGVGEGAEVVAEGAGEVGRLGAVEGRLQGGDVVGGVAVGGAGAVEVGGVRASVFGAGELLGGEEVDRCRWRRRPRRRRRSRRRRSSASAPVDVPVFVGGVGDRVAGAVAVCPWRSG